MDDHEIELFTLTRNAMRGRKCDVAGCKATPLSSGLCRKHEDKQSDELERWELEKLLQKHAPEIYKHYLDKYGNEVEEI